MRRIASDVKLLVNDDGAARPVEMIPEPLFRFNDPARDFSDGSIWGYGRKGRPIALLSLSLHSGDGGALGWLYESNSLSSHPVEAVLSPGMSWSTRKRGLEFQLLPDAPAPATKEAGRTRQFREISGRFSGFESFRKDAAAKLERYELRLVPRPIYRYSDAGQGLIDGALFLLTYGTNPEVVLAIELVREGEEPPAWKFAFTRISFAELHIQLDDKEIWTQPHLQGTKLSDDFFLFFRPLKPGELDDE